MDDAKSSLNAPGAAESENDYRALFTRMHPGFWDRDDIRRMPADAAYEEMVLFLEDFDRPEIPVPAGTAFGFYRGDFADFLSRVALVDEDWTKIYQPDSRIFCGTVGGELASFCMIEDWGGQTLSGRTLRVGGPGCVGTVPAFRRRGIGLEMVRRVTGILRSEGFDVSYIHYTGVAAWYEKLGYQTVLRWNREGFTDRRF